MKIAIVKYNAGNIQSVLFALERIGVQGMVTDDAEQIRSADRVIFPGVGEARSAMNYLQERKLDVLIRSLTQPVLGICLGMQLLCDHSEENDTPCLGIFNTRVKRFSDGLKVPQVGWNTVKEDNKERYYYFVHSYYAEVCAETVAVTNYGIEFSSALRKNNFYGVQFHPEKSGKDGEQLLKNFLSL
jgi:glutamine amidotransferase